MSEAFKIQGLAGAHKLSGTVRVTGAKNAALKVVAATILFRDKVTLTNIPEINDIGRMFDLLSDLGAKIVHPKTYTYEVSIPDGFKTVLTPEIAKRFRGSVVATGPILARFGKVSFPYPGGCLIGSRPIDLFLEGFEKMGARITLHGTEYNIEAPKGGLRGAKFFLKKQSVTVTETFMLAAVLAKGTTIIKNVAMEPEIEDLANFLNRCGAKISGHGTSTITIRGGKLLSGKSRVYKTMPDRIDAGSFLVLGALAAKDLRITNCNPLHLEALIETLRTAGADIETTKTEIRVRCTKTPYRAVHIMTHEYPGFPTDLQAPMIVFLTQAEGESKVFETIFEGRLNFTEALSAMGANITIMDPHRALVRGQSALMGRRLESPDLRAGLAFVIAAIVAKGESVIHNVDRTIDRGYERVEERLQGIGVDIERVKNGAKA